MSTIGFIGLGIMGSPMAVHLQEAGHQVSGYNKRRDTSGPLVEAGGRKASSIADAVQGADVVAIMVPDSPDVQEVLTGPGGVFESAAPGTLVIDFSSIRPDVTAELAQIGERARLPDARRARLRRRGGRQERRAVDHGRRRGRGLRGRRADLRRGRQDDRACRPQRSGPDGQGSQPADRRHATSRCSPRRSCSSRPMESTPKPRWTSSAAGWPAPRCSSRSAATC